MNAAASPSSAASAPTRTSRMSLPSSPSRSARTWPMNSAGLASIGAIRRLALTLFPFFVLCAPAHASRTMEIGIQDDAVFIHQAGMTRQQAFDRAEELGVTKIRANLLWSRVLTGSQANRRTRPAKPHYDFTLFDGLVDDARERGLKV